MGRRASRVAFALVTTVAVGTLSVRYGALGWLVADDGTVRNVMEGLSWPASVLALLLAAFPALRRWLAGRSTPDSAADALGSSNVLLGRALYLVDGRLPQVREVGLLHLRVKPAIDTFDDDGEDLPPYVEREFDKDLEWALSTGGMVLLHGRAAVGKSRAAAAAIRRLRPDDALIVPRDGIALRELVTNRAVPERAVIWLDDLELYIGADGLDIALLQQLSPNRGTSRTVVVATIRDEELSRLTAASRATSKKFANVDRAAADLIAQVQGRRRIRVNAKLTAAETLVADRLGERDSRIRRAIEAKEGFAEHLAAGIAMMDRWQVGDGPLYQIGQALISAAVDCRRAGHHKPISAGLLEKLYPQYLDPVWAHRTDLPPFSRAIHWAQEPVLGASSCLQPHPNNTNLASDYLVDQAQSGRTSLPERVNDAVWRALLADDLDVDLRSIGQAAYLEQRLDVATEAVKRIADSGNSDAIYTLGLIYLDERDHDKAAQFLLRAAEAGQQSAHYFLGRALLQLNRYAEAEKHLRHSVSCGEDQALPALGLTLVRLGRKDEAVEYLQRAFEAGNKSVSELTGMLLYQMGRTDESVKFLREASESGDKKALAVLGQALFNLDRVEEAEEVLRRCVDAGDKISLGLLGIVLSRRGLVPEAEGYLRRAGRAGNVHALTFLGNRLMVMDRDAEAEECLRLAVDMGDGVHAPKTLGFLMCKLGRFDEGADLLRSVTSADDAATLKFLGYLLTHLHQNEEAIYYLEQAAEAGDRSVLTTIGKLLAHTGRVRDSIDVLQQAVASGDESAVTPLAAQLALQHEWQQVAELLSRYSYSGDGHRLLLLGLAMAALNRHRAATIYLREATDLGFNTAQELLDVLISEEDNDKRDD